MSRNFCVLNVGVVVTPADSNAMPFTDFWAAYPRREARKDALKAWTKLNPSSELETQILAALDWQRERPEWLKNDGQYVPLAGSWIRGERWLDERRNGHERRKPWEDWYERCQHEPKCGSAGIHDIAERIDRNRKAKQA